MSETKLLPCPFCGGNASLLEKADEFGNYSVMCNRARCMAEGSPCYSVEAAIAEWNARALTPKQEAADEMREALTICEHVLSDLPSFNMPESRVRNAWIRAHNALAKAGRA